jgi:hypothetical protein
MFFKISQICKFCLCFEGQCNECRLFEYEERVFPIFIRLAKIFCIVNRYSIVEHFHYLKEHWNFKCVLIALGTWTLKKLFKAF